VATKGYTGHLLGAALVLVERSGEGPARVLGVGESSDAYHMTAPHPEGLGARLAMERALADAALEPARVDHINAHATGTTQNDSAEARAIHSLLGAETRVVATKGYTGHLLGAAGATEIIFSVAAIERALVPASVGATPVDPAVRVRVTLDRESCRSEHVLSNSFAFGGSNVSVLLGGPT
jgi:3-oxoacyl-[acyl-carrier-protein] synthase-1